MSGDSPILRYTWLYTGTQRQGPSRRSWSAWEGKTQAQEAMRVTEGWLLLCSFVLWLEPGLSSPQKFVAC